MSATTDKRIETLLDKAEKSGACCAPEDRATRAAMRRRSGKIVEPIRGLFFRADAWEHLEPPERMRHLMRALTQAPHLEIPGSFRRRGLRTARHVVTARQRINSGVAGLVTPSDRRDPQASHLR